MSAEVAETKTVRLSDRLTVTLSVSPLGITAEWSPYIPSRLSGGELRRYRQARDEMLARLASRVGGGVLLIET